MKDKYNKATVNSREYDLNIEPSPYDERDYVAETIFPPLTVGEELPDSVDHRSELRPIRDQGSQGTCAGQTAACMKEWEEVENIGLIEYLSPQFIYDHRQNQDTAGMYPRNVMDILKDVGVCIERYYPYGTPHKPEEIPQKAKDDAKNFRIQGYARVDSVEGLKKALLKQGPCMGAWPVYNYGMRMWKAQQGETMRGGHAMAIVGYNKDGFIVRNSWGDDWGDKGYTIYPYEDFGCHWELWSTIDDKSSQPFDRYFLKNTPKIKLWWYNFKKKLSEIWKSHKAGIIMFGAFVVIVVTIIIIKENIG